MYLHDFTYLTAVAQLLTAEFESFRSPCEPQISYVYGYVQQSTLSRGIYRQQPFIVTLLRKEGREKCFSVSKSFSEPTQNSHYLVPIQHLRSLCSSTDTNEITINGTMTKLQSFHMLWGSPEGESNGLALVSLFLVHSGKCVRIKELIISEV